MRFWFPSWIRAITALTVFGGCAGGLLLGCAPSLNWREVRIPQADGLVASFPCKPDEWEQRMSWPGVRATTVQLWSCRAGGYRWSVAAARLTDATEVPVALQHWAATWQGQPGYRAATRANPPVPGSTPQPAALAFQLMPVASKGGAAPKPLPTGWSWHFSHGLIVFQATVWMVDGGELPTNSEDVVSLFKNGFYFQK